MDRKSEKSSNLVSVGYDEKTKTLEVEFKGGGVYTYSDVPKSKYDGLLNADSPGSYFHAHIRSGHKGERQ